MSAPSPFDSNHSVSSSPSLSESAPSLSSFASSSPSSFPSESVSSSSSSSAASSSSSSAREQFTVLWKKSFKIDEKTQQMRRISNICVITPSAEYNHLIALLDANIAPKNNNEKTKMKQFRLERVNIENQRVTKLYRRAVEGGENRRRFKFGGDVDREVVPAEQAFDHLMRLHHEESGSLAHIGYEAAYKTISKKYYGITKEMVHLINIQCMKCRRSTSIKSGRKVKQIKSHRSYWRWQMDLIDMQRFSTVTLESTIERIMGELTMQGFSATDPTLLAKRFTLLEQLCKIQTELKESLILGNLSSYRYIMVVKDHFTRYAWLRPIRNKECSTVALKLKEIFQEYGVPRIMQTDNGGEFIGVELLELFKSYNIRHIQGRAFHSQSQGSVEQLNGVIEKRLAKYLPCDQHDNPRYGLWHTVIQQVAATQNSIVSRVLNNSPYRLMWHRDFPTNDYLIDDETIAKEEEIVLKESSDHRISEQVFEEVNNIIMSQTETDSKSMEIEEEKEEGEEGDEADEGETGEEKKNTNEMNNEKITEDGNPDNMEEVEEDEQIVLSDEEMKEVERKSADESAARARRTTQRRYSAHAQEFNVGDLVSVNPDDNFIEKVNIRSITGIILSNSFIHGHYYIILYINHRAFKITDAVPSHLLSPLNGVNVSDPILRDILTKIRSNSFSSHLHCQSSLTFRAACQLYGTDSLGCKCGAGGRKGAPRTCGFRCKCVKAGQECGSSCHPGSTCNHKENKIKNKESSNRSRTS